MRKMLNEGMLKIPCKICYHVGTLSGGFYDAIEAFKNSNNSKIFVTLMAEQRPDEFMFLEEYSSDSMGVIRVVHE